MNFLLHRRVQAVDLGDSPYDNLDFIDENLNEDENSPNLTIRSKLQSHRSRTSAFFCRLKPWQWACIAGWIVFITFHFVLGQIVDNPRCLKELNVQRSWYSFVCFGVTIGFFLIWVILVSRITRNHSQIEQLDRSAYFAYLNVVSMGLITSLLSLFIGWGGLCVDHFGVATPAVVWGEWFAAGPIIFVIISTTIIGKSEMDCIDWLLVNSFILTILFGFLLIFVTDPVGAIICLALSFLANIPQLFTFCLLKSRYRRDILRISDSNPVTFNEKKMDSLAFWVTATMPLFGVTYMLAIFRVISLETSAATFQLLSMVIKGFYGVLILDLHEEAAVISKWMLQQEILANNSRRSHLKYVFHEVRNPLNSLVLGIDILEQSDTVRDESERESLIIMRSSADFMSATLNDVLSMQKIEEGKMELEMRNFHTPDVVTKVFSAFRGAAVGKDLRLQLTVAEGFPAAVLGDRFKIEHVVANLLSNAIKFSPRGAVVEVALSEMPYMGSKSSDEWISNVVIDVKDQGPGISAEDQVKLFNNFVQINAGELQQGAGSGLGLSLCKQMVELHGGKLTVISAKGQGSTFRVTIPFHVDSDYINKSNHSTSGNHIDSNANSFSAVGRSLRVLVVDDAESNSKMMKTLLSKIGISAATAENGQVAVDMIMEDKDKFDIVFMDNQMPVMNGLTASKVLREKGFDHLIIGVTGNVMEDDVLEFRSAGVDIVLSKPLRLNTLQALVRFVDTEGCTSKVGFKLLEQGCSFEWI